MDALKEVPRVRQVDGEPRRRWFSSLELDLIVWLDAQAQPIGFQLCYDKTGRERALTWRPQRGFEHDLVDSGEHGNPRYKGTPILRRDDGFDRDRVQRAFLAAADDIPHQIRAFVSATMDSWPGIPAVGLQADRRALRRRPPWWRFWDQT